MRRRMTIRLSLALACLLLGALVVPPAAEPRVRGPHRADADRDGVSNRYEVRISRTNPRRADTDRDGLRDRAELRRYRTSPRKPDTDGDGVRDGREVRLGRDPRRPDGASGPAPAPADRPEPSPSPSPAPAPSPPPAPAPSPSPTPSPSPSPSPAPGLNCMPDPSRCGFPDLGTTGVRNAAALAPVSGTVVLSTAGQVLENKLVTGKIEVRAPNVVVRNVKLVMTNPWYGIDLFAGAKGTLIEDVEIDANGHLNAKMIAFDEYTARRVFFHDGSDCAHFGANVTVEDSLCVTGPDADGDAWPDSAGFCAGPEHIDGLQSDGGRNIVLRHNTIRNPCSETSAILMSTNTSPIRDVRVEDNLIGGGGYALYCNAGPDVQNETVTGNRVARTWFGKGGYWGPTTGCQDADVFGGNVWDETGAAL
jgi:Bacterial TSP3 repeat